VDAPERVLGLHFFSPAQVVRLLEIIRAGRTVPEVLATALDLARRIGKIPVIAGICDGFIGNRIHTQWRAQYDAALEDDVPPHEIDAAYVLTRAPEAIQVRVHAAMVNEACHILAEAIAARPSDIDVVLVHGFGYPAWRGGPMHEADEIGLPEMLRRVEAMSAAGGGEPAPLLRDLVNAGRRIADLNL
jgi:3-hydroxyacyl-CoA dehydrogenase